jgi:hypothetical protein
MSGLEAVSAAWVERSIVLAVTVLSPPMMGFATAQPILHI